MKNFRILINKDQIYVSYDTFIQICPKEMLPFRIEFKSKNEEIESKLRSLKPDSQICLDYIQVNKNAFIFEVLPEEIFAGEQGLLQLSIENVRRQAAS